MGLRLNARDPLAEIVQAVPGGVVVAVHVQPRAGTTHVVGRHGDALRIRVQAPPVDGRATDAARHVLAAFFGVPAASVSLVSGERSRLKRFRVGGLAYADARARVAAALDGAEGRGG